jgi:hypothetical protein
MRDVFLAALTLNKRCTEMMGEAGIEVQSPRISTNSFEEWLDCSSVESVLRGIKVVDEILQELGVGGGVSIGPAKSVEMIAAIPDILFASEKLACSFVTCDVANPTVLREDAALEGARSVLKLAHRAVDMYGKQDNVTGEYDYSDPRLVDTLFRFNTR